MARSGFKYATQRRKNRIPVYLLIAIAVVSSVIYVAVKRGTGLFRERTEISRSVVSVTDLWEDGHYSEVVEISESRLSENPMDRDALLFAGYSRFFLAISRLSTEERNTDLDAAIRHLRLLKARGGTPHPERVDYVLGKSYLLKGTYWADQAIEYLKASMDAGYQSDDSLEFMGRAYSALGDVNNALYWYGLAAESHPTDRLMITLGEEAFKLGLYNDAAEYYQQAIDNTRDDSLKKRGLSQLGQLYYDVGNYTMARGVLESLVEMEAGNQDYQFLLGETYHELGMDREARNAWFAVTRINPRHVGALRRLYD